MIKKNNRNCLLDKTEHESKLETYDTLKMVFYIREKDGVLQLREVKKILEEKFNIFFRNWKP